MAKKIIYSADAPSSPLYSQAVVAGNLVYLSGFTGIDPKTKEVAASGIQGQTRQAIRNCESVLRAAGSGLEDVVQVVVLLREPEDFEAMNGEYTKSFPRSPPTRMVTKLGVELPNIKVSIAMTALVSQGSSD